VHTWSRQNTHETRVTNVQRKFSVNVWRGVLGERLIGPFVFDNNLTGNTAAICFEVSKVFLQGATMPTTL
jgi:hypothetical protein